MPLPVSPVFAAEEFDVEVYAHSGGFYAGGATPCLAVGSCALAARRRTSDALAAAITPAPPPAASSGESARRPTTVTPPGPSSKTSPSLPGGATTRATLLPARCPDGASSCGLVGLHGAPHHGIGHPCLCVLCRRP